MSAIFLTPAVATEIVQFTGGPTQTLMLELYTSEGCSSCPPAEAYLNGYTENPELWTRYIPLAFHVDYWDAIGWKDRYADPTYTARQRNYAIQNASRTVYTPAFVANGAFWRPGILHRSPPSSDKQVGTLRVSVADGQIDAEMKPLIPLHAPLHLNVALLGMNLTTQIKAGENAGRLAEHQFVVLGLARTTSDDAHWNLNLPKAKLTATRYALAAWVSLDDDPTPLQATGGYLPGKTNQLK
ncbi:MAG: DUF1223 domain-containing protein [Gammaproteobacteria bacterium]|nr:DUF1223 domain-containing protein [Gammaproteobacteria bacterium]MBU2477775.1 DUF1223 domain-containing protein [Gammaproteobacteria bacterium]